MLAVERHYLHTYGGSFTENFYGLKRERVPHIKGGEARRVQLAVPSLLRETLKLRSSDVWKNLAVMVGLPYLKRKLDESYDIYAPQAAIFGPSYSRDTLLPNATIRQRIFYYYKWFLRKVYPSINLAYYFSLLIFNLAYLSSNTSHSSPFLFLIGTRIRRLSEADHRAIAQVLQPSQVPSSRGAPRPGQTTSILAPRTLFTTVYPRLLSSLKILLPASIFALKFLEWWHASDFANQLSRKAAEGLDLPPPAISGLAAGPPSSTTEPPPTHAPTNSVAISSTPSRRPSSIPKVNSKPSPPISTHSNLPILTVSPHNPSMSALCPICLHPMQTPTAAQTGYVFCYQCIFKWVEGNHDRQVAFMEGSHGAEGWGEDSDRIESEIDGSREGRWESGKGRCAVTARRLLGGTEGLRRVMV